MRRSLAICIAVLALAAAMAPPAGAQAPQGDDARYALANGCYALTSQKLGRQVATDVAPFRMQATTLGQYLLYGKRGDFLAAGSDDSVGAAASPDGSADWRVDVHGGAFRLSLPASGKVLVAGDGGDLRVVEPGAAGDDALFAFDRAEGCATYPEVDVSATGTPSRAETPYGEVRGLMDLHMHMMAFEFLGGSAHCGRPWHPYGAPYALVDCPDHATGIAPLETALKGKERHDPVGWPTFRDWPDNQSLTHESSYYKWLERAWMGGLRIFVNLLVDNAVLCELYPLKRNSCNEMDGVRLQARRLRELQDYIDAQNGGPGKGWFRIVKDPFEARRVISEGKLAVITGIEVSKLFDCGVYNDQPECDKAQIDRQLDQVYDLGVRQMELINKFDNALGGVAGDSGETGVVTNSGNRYETGRYWDMRTCDGDEHAHDREQITPHTHNDDSLLANGLAAFLPAGQAPVYPAPPHCNAKGLSDLGEHLVRRMMDKGMVVDPDHLSVLARNQLLNVVESRAYSGIVSSHSWSTPDSFPRIYKLGGVIAPYAGDSEGFVEKWRETKPMRDPRFEFGFGYGADMNGFGAQGGPRENGDVAYPFTSFDGAVTFDKQRSGERVYDINVDGVDHYGLYPDWIEDLRRQAGQEIVDDMARGPEAYLQMWERAEGVPASQCRAAHLNFSRRGLGGVRLGASTEALLRRASQPRTRGARTWRWCVRGRGNQDAEQVAVLTRQGRVALVASTARGHRARRVGPGARARALRKRTRRFGPGVRVRRAGGGRRLVYVVRSGRVRYVAVATRAASRDRATLRAHLRLTGLR